MQPRPCPSCSRVDAWRPRRGAGQFLAVWLLPIRGYRCAGCGETVWGLAGTGVNLARLAVWGLLAIALGWSVGRRPPDQADAANPVPDPPPAAAEVPTTSSASELAVLIPLWAEAWTEGRAADYLSFYSPEFAPESGETLDAWRAGVEAALASADRPALRFRRFEVESATPDRARVRLDRWAGDDVDPPSEAAERASAPQAAGGLLLELVREPGGWKIVRQRATG